MELSIPSLQVTAPIVKVGLTNLGAMASPKNGTDAGWFSLGVRPGDIGTAVIAGHSGYQNNKPGIFDNLETIKRGDTISITDDRGIAHAFVVRQIKNYPANLSNADEVFNSDDDKAHVNLITCGGFWNLFTRTHIGRTVVFADLAGR